LDLVQSVLGFLGAFALDGFDANFKKLSKQQGALARKLGPDLLGPR
jgi:hypothetical protein